MFVFSDDLWVVSKTLDFELDTFIACSAFFGPSSINEVELLPLKGYFPSNWPTNSKYYHAHIILYLKRRMDMRCTVNKNDDFVGDCLINANKNYLPVSYWYTMCS